MLKVQTLFKFVKTRKKERLIPTFANVKLAIKNGKHKPKSKLARLVMEMALQSKLNQTKKIKKELRGVNIMLKSSPSVIFYNCLIHQINIASKSKLKAITKRYLRKLDKFRRRTSSPINEDVTCSRIRNTIHNFSNYSFTNEEYKALPFGLDYHIPNQSSYNTTETESEMFTKTFCQTFHIFWTTN